MTNNHIDNHEIHVWCFPEWARFAGLLIGIFALLDVTGILQGLTYTIGFLLAMIGVIPALMNLQMAEMKKVGWLPLSYLIWAFTILFMLVLVRIVSGMYRDYLLDISIFSPLWLFFGIWLGYWSHQVIKNRHLSVAEAQLAKEMNARTLFRFSLLLLGLVLLTSSPPLLLIQTADGHSATFWPIRAEFMTLNEQGGGSGKIGTGPYIQSMLDQVLTPAFSATILALWWFPAQLLLIPLAWFLSIRSKWLWLRLMGLAWILAMASIPCSSSCNMACL